MSATRLAVIGIVLACCSLSRSLARSLASSHVYNREASIIPSFLHSLNRELKSGNPTKPVAAMQVHELLKAVEEHIGRALHEEGPQETLEVLHSVVRVLQTLSIEKSLVDSCFSF